MVCWAGAEWWWLMRGGRWRFFWGRRPKKTLRCCWAAVATIFKGGDATDLVGDGAKKEEQLLFKTLLWSLCFGKEVSMEVASRLSSLFDPNYEESLFGRTQGLLQRLINLLIVHISCLLSESPRLCRASCSRAARRIGGNKRTMTQQRSYDWVDNINTRREHNELPLE